MISISIHKDKKRVTWQMRAMDSGDNSEREILRGGGDSPRQAAIWLLRNVNRLAAEIEERLIELGFLTEAECEAALVEPEIDSTLETGSAPETDGAPETGSASKTDGTTEKPT
jgi:hypothetical protein